MNVVNGEKTFYGIDNINDKLDSIMNALNLSKYIFEVKLIISEALTNAYIHGNDSDSNKPINVSWVINNDSLCIKVRDSGTNKKEKLDIKKDIDCDILSESGRGLFIISAYTDEVMFKDNEIIMKKSLA